MAHIVVQIIVHTLLKCSVKYPFIMFTGPAENAGT
jgi:hypothetical protein